MGNLNTLNPQQREAVETLHGPLLILAGAGTGKTRVITFRIAHLIDRGVPPGQILAVTFTNKAAREMQERVRGALVAGGRRGRDEAADRPTISTFHSLCVRILRQHIERLGYKRHFVIFDESEQLSTVKKILSRISQGAGEKVDAAEVLAMLSRFKNGGERAAAFGKESVRALAEHIRARYELALKACNAVDFDDLILLTLRLLREFPEVLTACRERYRYVMVDEYQDTNAAQFELVHALTREHRNLCVVGDDDQSIYGWRGAEVANLLDLEKHFPEVKVIKLEQNYRSTSTILGAANGVIRHNARRRGKQLWSQKGEGAPIGLYCFENEDEEARTVVDEIEFSRRAQRIPWMEHAILFRTNIQSRPLETALRKTAVRYRLVGGQSFFDRREIRDVLAYLKVFVNPDDDVSLLRIANVPARGLSETTMERLLGQSQERGCSVHAAMRHTDVLESFSRKTQESLRAFVALIAEVRSRFAADPAVPLRAPVEEFLHDSGYLEELRRSEKDPEIGENRVRNLLDLVATLETAGVAGGEPLDRLGAFLEDLALDRDREGEKDAAADQVTLITMHSCKGLEFPHVYIVGCEEGLLPHTRSKEEGTVDEERRLFYVAITRAMKALAISHCETRKKYGQAMACHPSRFLSELPPEFVERADERSRRPVSVDRGKNLFAGLRTALEE